MRLSAIIAMLCIITSWARAGTISPELFKTLLCATKDLPPPLIASANAELAKLGVKTPNGAFAIPATVTHADLCLENPEIAAAFGAMIGHGKLCNQELPAFLEELQHIGIALTKIDRPVQDPVLGYYEGPGFSLSFIRGKVDIGRSNKVLPQNGISYVCSTGNGSPQ